MASELDVYTGRGDGHDGAKIIGGTENINSYATVTGSSGSTTVTTALSVSVGDKVLLHQTQHATTSGFGEIVTVSATGGGSFTIDKKLANAYTSGAQAILIPQYTDLTINGTLQPTAWNGSVGGIAIAFATGKISGTGTLNLKGRGFVGGVEDTGAGNTGEGHEGPSLSNQTSSNGNGGGGGSKGISGTEEGGGGAGAGNKSVGSVGHTFTGTPAVGGDVSGNTTLTDFDLPGAGGAGGADFQSRSGQDNDGGNGAANFMFVATTIDFSSMTLIDGQGNDGGDANAGVSFSGGGGAGAGGCGILRATTIDYGTNIINLAGGIHGEGTNQSGGTNDGGDGSDGRLRVEGCSITGSALNATVSEIEGGHTWCGSLAAIIE